MTTACTCSAGAVLAAGDGGLPPTDGLRWYLQAFSGYGQTLLDYNFRQTSVGAGLALFEF